MRIALRISLLFFLLFHSEYAQKPVDKSPPVADVKLVLAPCDVPGADEGKTEKALCGTYTVFENRALKTGRQIGLKIVVFPATGSDKLPDPVFYLAGGPGSSATEDAPYIAQELAKIRERRDLVFVDQRGTGGSNPLNCDLFDPADAQNYLGHWNPLDKVRECRRQLEKKADLSLYTTVIAMADLDDVRSALGLKQINLMGGSYGTRASLTYIKHYGRNVRSAVLQGISPTNQFMPRDFPQHTERALNGVLDECAADKACRESFPNLCADVKNVLATLLRGPVETEVTFPQRSGKSVPIKLSRDLAAEAIRYMLYQTGAASRIPLILHTAATGNFKPLAEAALNYRVNLVATGSNGMYLSVTCAEDLPWIKPGEGEGNGQNTFLGDYRLVQQREGCAEWVRSPIPKDYATPTRSDVPVLILTGQWDPVTPPVYGDTAAKYLKNSLHIIVPSGGHGFGGLEGIGCISNLTSNFFSSGSVKGLDTACVKSIRRAGFRLKFQ